MAPEISSSVAAPLFLLVSLAIMRVCRSTSPENYVGVKGWEFLPLRWGDQPELGPINFLYKSNNFVLLLTFAMVIDSYEGDIVKTAVQGSGALTVIIISLVVFIVWIICPILQFDEYQQIPPAESSSVPQSFKTHAVIVTIMAIGIIVSAIIYGVTDGPDRILVINPIRLLGLIFMVILILGFTFGTTKFLKELEREIEEI